MRGARGSLAIAASLAAGLLCVLAAGASAGDALEALWDGALGNRSALADTVNRATPLCIAGLALSLAFRAGALNIGGEGQILGGACAAVAVGRGLEHWHPIVAIPAVLVAAAAGGAATGALAAALRRWRGVPEVLSTILLNFVMAELVSWLVRGPLQETLRAYPQSDPIAESARLPRILPPTSMHAGALLAVALAPLLWGFLFRTAAGLRLRAVGLGPRAARFAGFHPEATVFWALVGSAALAGLAGGVQVAGHTGRLYGNLSGGVGFMAIAVALLGRLEPFEVVAASLFFGILGAAAAELQRSAGISSELAQVVQAATLLGLLASDHLFRRAVAARGA